MKQVKTTMPAHKDKNACTYTHTLDMCPLKNKKDTPPANYSKQ